MERIKAIIYGVGVVGKVTTRYLVNAGVDIVGAIDTNPEIIGKDLGEVAGLGRPLNLKITDDAGTVLMQNQADVALVSVFSYLEKMYPLFEKCIENKINVITASEEALYPWIVAPEWASKLDRLAKHYGVTIIGTGLQDVFRVNLVSVLTGASHTLESITGTEKWDMSFSGPAALANYPLGLTAEQFNERMKGQHKALSTFKIALHAVLADLGLTIKKEIESIEPVTDEVDVEASNVPGGGVKKGLNTGMCKVTDIETKEGIGVRGEQLYKLFNKAEKAEGQHLLEWVIKGVPTIRVKSSMTEFEAKSSVVAQLVQRIPDVLNSEPGFITIEKLPKPKFKTFPLHYYVKNHKAGSLLREHRISS